MQKFLLVLLFLMVAVGALAASLGNPTISEVGLAPSPLLSTDKFPLGRVGGTTAYTGSIGQVLNYVETYVPTLIMFQNRSTATHTQLDAKAPITSGTGLLRGDGFGGFSTAHAGIHYEVPLTFTGGVTRVTNTVTVDTTQNINRLSGLTANGIVTTSGSNGALSVNTSLVPKFTNTSTAFWAMTPKFANTTTALNAHKANTSNPHNVTYAQIGAMPLYPAEIVSSIAFIWSFMAGQTFTAGELGYISTDGFMYKADASSAVTAVSKLGIAFTNISGSTSGKFLVFGLHSTAFGTYSAGRRYYVSDTPGAAQITAPSGSGKIVRVIGFGLSKNKLSFEPSPYSEELP